MTPEEIETFTNREMYRPFPYTDCKKLSRFAVYDDGFIPDFDMYVADIVGFCSGATRLNAREVVQVEQYLPRMRQGFFELHPQHKELQQYINTADTPMLQRDLNNVELLRKEILPLLEERLSGHTKERF